MDFNVYISSLSALEYEQLADETLDSVSEVFEDLPERLSCDPEYDVTFGVSHEHPYVDS